MAVVFLFVAGVSWMSAQQKPVHSQYMINRYKDNPAFGGMERSLSVFATYREQYSALPARPRTLYLGADMPFYLWNGAVGMTLYNQEAGVFDHTQLKVSYNYVLGTDVGFLSFGGRAGWDFMSVNGAGILTPEGDYEGVFNHNDPILQNNVFSGGGLTWDAGVYFWGRYIEAGLTLSDWPSHSYRVGNALFSRSFYGTVFGMYKYTFSEDIRLASSLMIRWDRASVQSELGFLAHYQENLIMGLNLRGYNSRSLDALSFILGTQMGEKYRLIYSYDLGLSSLSSVHDGSHEVTLTYNLRKMIGSGLPPKIIYNPRDL
jgi:type IX secretion system PorP/SprF family membrane protein